MENPTPQLPPGWQLDAEGHLRRATLHRMARRCLRWDYRAPASYLITLVLNDRSRPLLGQVRPCPSMDGRVLPSSLSSSLFTPTPLGQQVADTLLRLGTRVPGIQVVGVQAMPEHLHAVLRVTCRLERPLGEYLRGFKIAATKTARDLGVLPSGPPPGAGEAARGHGLFADGFTDTILGSPEAFRKGIAYMFDNPRRLAVKRAHPDLFRVVGDLAVPLRQPLAGLTHAHFAAVGNRALLMAPHLLPVQVSRRDFAYRRTPSGSLLRPSVDGRIPPVHATPAFEEKAAALLAAAAHGAVLVSPCISKGEREIAARAHEAGCKVIALKNKGFSPLHKPGGRLFGECAAGNLLLLAPARWPHLPGRKPMTRIDACILNRLARLLADPDSSSAPAYRGRIPGGIDALAAEAVAP